ncbi:hypothetical protein EMPG_15421 [Blastomyces silverae]|uniref:Uncharacterized protein n=1 Tax=Blastomyces silverae TaxID=2060906 RepID=A0A0H1BCR6_9EURO|nr:hypothetical protein EMPG_15421 [Blastomyces silverae]
MKTNVQFLRKLACPQEEIPQTCGSLILEVTLTMDTSHWSMDLHTTGYSHITTHIRWISGSGMMFLPVNPFSANGSSPGPSIDTMIKARHTIHSRERTKPFRFGPDTTKMILTMSSTSGSYMMN